MKIIGEKFGQSKNCFYICIVNLNVTEMKRKEIEKIELDRANERFEFEKKLITKKVEDEYLEDEALKRLELEEINDEELAKMFNDDDDDMDYPSIADYSGFVAI